MSIGNRLYYGDNLPIMEELPRDCVDLIYLDPPFNSNKNYNLMYRDMTGRHVSEQVEAFCDTWEMDAEKEELANKMPILMRKQGIEDYYVQFWRLWIPSPSKHPASASGVPDLHGSANHADEDHPEADRIDISSLRPDGIPLHQGHDGRDFRTQEFYERDHLEKNKCP